MKFKTAISVLILVAVFPVLAEDTIQPTIPAYVQTILTKYDKQVDAAQRTYWQTILTADKAKLKDLQTAMVTAAKQNNADVIPVIQKVIDETKEKIKQDTIVNGIPITGADNSQALALGKWAIPDDTSGNHVYDLLKDGSFTVYVNAQAESIDGSWFVVGDVLVLTMPAHQPNPSWVRFGQIKGDTANIMCVIGDINKNKTEGGRGALKRVK